MPVSAGGGDSGIGRVVIVEDQRLVAEFLQFHCRDLRLQVVRHCSGFVEGLAAIRELKPDLVLLDISLPDGDGLELARMIIEELPRVKVEMREGLAVHLAACAHGLPGMAGRARSQWRTVC